MLSHPYTKYMFVAVSTISVTLTVTLYDCDTSWCPFMIVTLFWPLFDCDTSWDLSMTVALPLGIPIIPIFPEASL